MNSDSLYGLLLIITLILLRGLIVMAYNAFANVRQSALRDLADEGHRGARRLLPLLERSSDLEVSHETSTTLLSIAIAAIGFIVWGHHMFVAGQSPTAGIVFSFLTYLVAIPSAIKVFNWVATLYKGAIDFKAPMIYALSFIYLFGIGGLTGLFLASIANNVHLHDTYFVIAHFHMVMVGSVLTAFLGGVHHWWPKMTGRMFNESFAKASAILVFFGFNLTFFPQFVMGSQGMPRRYFDYLPEFETMHVLSTVGSWVLGVGLLMVLFNMIWSLFRGKPAPGNPWGAATLEWTHATSPPDHHNFHRTPLVTHGPYDYDVLFSGDGAGDGAGGVRQAGDPAPIPDPEVGGPQETSSVDQGVSPPDSTRD